MKNTLLLSTTHTGTTTIESSKKHFNEYMLPLCIVFHSISMKRHDVDVDLSKYNKYFRYRFCNSRNTLLVTTRFKTSKRSSFLIY